MKDIRIEDKVNSGDAVIVTHPVGWEGTRRLIREREEELSQQFSSRFLAKGKEESVGVSWENYGEILSLASYAKEIVHRGFYGALWDFAKTTSKGFFVVLEDVPLEQLTVEICETYDLNPYQLWSGGSLLLTSSHGRQLVDLLHQEGIPGTIVGHTVSTNAKTIYRQGKLSNMEAPREDEFERICQGK